MKRLFHGVKGSTTRLVVVGVSVALITGTTGAVAADLLTGKDIKNNSLGAKELKKKLRKKINKGSTAGTAGAPGQAGAAGAQGQQGPPGATGAQGSPGASGIASYENPEWSQIDRNTIGSPQVELRGGPIVGTSAPPLGDGSLGLTVFDGPAGGTGDAEAASFGNESEFFGDLVGDIDELGFYVYTTGENNAKGSPNMPGIKIEIDPNLDSTPSNYSTLTFQPSNTTANQWSGYIDATTAPASTAGNGFFLSSDAGTATGCTLSDPCTFTEAQDALDDGGAGATILSVAVGKGRDLSWSGAVDGLTLNDTIYDFEPFGVVETTP